MEAPAGADLGGLGRLGVLNSPGVDGFCTIKLDTKDIVRRK